MTYEEFSQLLGGGWWDQVNATCQVQGCGKTREVQKASALANFLRNQGVYKCPSCAYTAEGRARIAKASSYPRSEDTKRRMSEAKKAFYQTPRGQKVRELLSKLTAQGHSENRFENAKRKGLYLSDKNGRPIPCGSSYELFYCDQLEHDDAVLSYEGQVWFEWGGRHRCLDFLIVYDDGTIGAHEVKPKARLGEQLVVDQIADSRGWAAAGGFEFRVITEDELGATYPQMRAWADEYVRSQTGVDLAEHRRELRRASARKHYQNKIATDKVEVFCEYCQQTHTPLRKTYERNIAEHDGEYWCEAYGGSISGKKPKPHLRKANPYAAEGMKQCAGECQAIKPLDEFGIDKSQPDGRARVCKVDRAKKASEKYHAKEPKPGNKP